MNRIALVFMLFTGWDTQSPYFPKVTLCDFQIREALHPRDSHRYTVQCVLPLNLFSQQVYSPHLPFVSFPLVACFLLDLYF